MTCHSGGTLEIYVEPQLPAPKLWVAGTTPIAGALAELGAAAGFAVTVIDPIAEPDAFPGPSRVVGSADLESAWIREPRPTWSSPPRASGTRKRWSPCPAPGRGLRRARGIADAVGVVREYLARRRRARRTAGRLRAPAGLDLGAETPAEVALSILAELIQVRRGRAAFVAAPGPGNDRRRSQAGRQRALADAAAAGGPEDVVLLDPVCGMTVERDDARHLAEHDGVVYAFCSLGCRTRFIKDPHGLPAGRVAVPARSRQERADAVLGHDGDPGTARARLGLPHRRRAGRILRAGCRVGHGHRRHPFQGARQGRHRFHLGPLQRRHGTGRAGRRPSEP